MGLSENFLSPQTHKKILRHKNNFKKSALSCIRKTAPIIFICSVKHFFSTRRQHDFLASPLCCVLHIINYNHFKFSTKQLITLINTFQSRVNVLIINLLYFFLPTPHVKCVSFWVLITMQRTKKGTENFLDFTLVTRSSFRSVEIVMTWFLSSMQTLFTPWNFKAM